VRFNNVSVNGKPGAYQVQLAGADPEHNVRDITFDKVSILGTNLMGHSPQMRVGDHVLNVRFWQ
jgi:hypothetical protein